jgi:hypothetical protein
MEWSIAGAALIEIMEEEEEGGGETELSKGSTPSRPV